MIKTIRISGVATYSEDVILAGLAKVNYLFGSNGSGKTTLSRIILDHSQYPSCELKWENSRPLETLVYNRDFVDRHFHAASEFPGIFTLGEEDAAQMGRIDDLKIESAKLLEDIRRLTITLHGEDKVSGKSGELHRQDETFQNKCWNVRKQHLHLFKDVFAGNSGSKSAFAAKVLSKRQNKKIPAGSLHDLQGRAKIVFNDAITRVDSLPLLTTSDLSALENSPILAKKVIGKTDVDIAALIERLGASDWVRNGLIYVRETNGLCPFCQQATVPEFQRTLEDYFDDAFEADIASIVELEAKYKSDSARCLAELDVLRKASSQFIETAQFQSLIDSLKSAVKINLERIAAKRKEPSRVIVAESTVHIFSQIKDVLMSANEQIAAHNLTVDNLTTERTRLIDDVWQYLLTHDLNDAVALYDKDSRGLKAAIAAIERQIEEKRLQIASADAEIRKLQRGITSVQPTVDAINSLLATFGFTGFNVAATEDGKRYKLLRENGADAKQTLSEGERTFVTFLYFFHRLQGGLEGTAVSGDRVVVFDDPVSSLDSNVLFVVSTLVRKIVEEAIIGSKAIKQVFVLTHNVYFHKEVSFDAKRGEGKRPHETFWLVTKNYGQSSIQSHDTNPVKTSYELLWRELKKPLVDNLSVQNTLRRILENYFKILGNIDIAVVLNFFEGRQSIACRSLLSWVNDGSHFAWDDAFCQVDGVTTEMYLEVFRLIFEKLNHSAHYEMMMGLTSASLAEVPRPSVPVSAAK